MTNDSEPDEQQEVAQAETSVTPETKPAITEVSETDQAAGIADETRVEMKRKENRFKECHQARIFFAGSTRSACRCQGRPG
jgi:hypothetical protein